MKQSTLFTLAVLALSLAVPASAGNRPVVKQLSEISMGSVSIGTGSFSVSTINKVCIEGHAYLMVTRGVVEEIRAISPSIVDGKPERCDIEKGLTFDNKKAVKP